MDHHPSSIIIHTLILDCNYPHHMHHVHNQLYLLLFQRILHDQSKNCLIRNHDHVRKISLHLFHIIHGMLLKHLPFQKNYGIDLYFLLYILNSKQHLQYELTLEIKMCFHNHLLNIKLIHINFNCN